MVHWPEVMVTYDIGEKILFSADAFGTFGALNGALFADEVDFFHDYIDEARRYYTNIVGKYGPQVQAVLKKAAGIEIKMVCPLHGFVWRKKFNQFLEKYIQWATYTPEETGVVIAYASVYGNTANTADVLAAKLRDLGIKTEVYDASYTAADEILAAAFRYSHLVFASTTYNAGIYIAMENLLHDIVNHNLQNRTVALIENGSWAPAAGGLMHDLLAQLPGTKFIDQTVTVRSSLKECQMGEIDAMVQAIAATMPGVCAAQAKKPDARAILRTSPAGNGFGRRRGGRRSQRHVQILLWPVCAHGQGRRQGQRLHHQHRFSADRYTQAYHRCCEQGKLHSRHDPQNRRVQRVRSQ